jgi:hypothetical protein
MLYLLGLRRSSLLGLHADGDVRTGRGSTVIRFGHSPEYMLPITSDYGLILEVQVFQLHYSEIPLRHIRGRQFQVMESAKPKEAKCEHDEMAGAEHDGHEKLEVDQSAHPVWTTPGRRPESALSVNWTWL